MANETTAPQRPTYLVCGCTPWAAGAYRDHLQAAPGCRGYLGKPEDLDFDILASYYPGLHYLFFLHWRWRVPPAIVRDYECVGFHLGDLQIERGGTPLQYAIAQGHEQRPVTAFRLTDDWDAGPVYGQAPVALHGTAEEIYNRMMDTAARLALWIARSGHAPVPLQGPLLPPRPRRTPAASRIRDGLSLQQVYDAIRMLDAADYPPAFLDWGGLRLSFTRAGLYTDEVRAEVSIRPLRREEEAT